MCRSASQSRACRALAGVLIAIGILLLLPGGALAHAHLVRADLAPDTRLTVPEGVVHFWFDEPLNGALSKIVIKDAQGRQVNTDTGTLNASDNQELDVYVPALSAGQYTVFWTSDSAQDGHILHGFYVFTAGGSGAQAIGAVSGTITGQNTLSLDSTGLANALAHWLVLLTSTVWTGALLFELLVLRPLRTRAAGAITVLSDAASERIAAIIQIGLLATLVASVVELEAQAYAVGGSLLSLDVLRNILHSHYGAFWLVRLACIFLVQVALMLLPTAPNGRIQIGSARRTAYLPVYAAGLFGGAYLLGIAMSGHADSVAQMVATSVLLDWLHLLANTAWIGGMATIALVLVPALLSTLRAVTGDGNDSRLAFLVILGRYSPLAMIAVPTAMFTGIFNAQVHLSSLDAFFSSQYGRFLIVKLILILAIVLISASHVFLTRPRLQAILAGQDNLSPVASFVSLMRRLAIEPLLGAGVLLCVALMGEVAPAVTLFATAGPSSASTAAPIPSPLATPVSNTISGTAKKGLLDVSLTIDSAVVGQTRLFAIVRERGKVVQDGQVRIKLSVPGDSSIGAAFVETSPSGGGYAGSGDLAQNGRWQADVLVRTRSDPLEYRDVPFQFVAGSGAGFLPPGLDPASIQIAMSPGKLSVPNSITLSNLHASGVQLLSESLDMNMGAETVDARSLGNGKWRTTGTYAPMEGRWSLTVQIRAGAGWTTVRQFIYRVPLNGPIVPLSAPTPVRTATPRATPKTQANNSAFAKSLPYTAIVTEMGSAGVRLLGESLVHTGLQAHGIDVLDGTPYAFVTNFGADPGTVSKIDIRTMKVIQTFAVGLGPAHIVFMPDHKRAFVTNFRSNDLYVLDFVNATTKRIAFPSDTCFEPHGIDLSDDSRTAYVACGGGSWIYPVDTGTLQPGQPIITAPGAFGVAVDKPRHEVWVTNQTSNDVTVVDEKTRGVLATVPVGKGPALLAISPNGHTVYVADQLGNDVSVIDAASRKIAATIPVASQPHGLDVTGDGKYVYVASIGGNAVTIIRASDNRVMAVVPALTGANEVAIAN